MRITLLLGIPFLILFFSLITLIIPALLKYPKSKDVRKEKAALRVTLGERLTRERINHKMTQEFVVEAIGASRQSVYK